MAITLVVPMLVLVERVNLHWPWDVSQCAAREQGKDPAGVAGKGGLGKAGADVGGHQEWRGTLALPLPTLEPFCHPGVAACPWAILPPRS